MDDDRLEFPNKMEREILTHDQKKAKNFKEKLKFTLWKYPKINQYFYNYTRKKKNIRIKFIMLRQSMNHQIQIL